MRRRVLDPAFASMILLVLPWWGILGRAAERDGDRLERDFVEVQPLVARYCGECHGSNRAEAELAFGSTNSVADVRSQIASWVKVLEMLESEQMPPPDSDQPDLPDREKMRKWVEAFLKFEARRLAGDPGPVVLRRLTNAEYTFAIHDLTRVATLRPTREFPADGAAGEGFTNAGNALQMSPAMLAKYLDAGKEVASHLVLLPDGIRFSAHNTRRDWTDEVLAEIRRFYHQYCDSQGASQVNLQGIVFDTNGGGRLPLDRYLAATIDERETLGQGTSTIEQVARARHLSPKYLGLLWQFLNGASDGRPGEKAPPSSPSVLVTSLRNQWRSSTSAEIPKLCASIGSWQQSLWRFTSVGHIGKTGGPKSWLEPISPLLPRHELRSKLPAAEPGNDVVVYLVAGDAGDGSEQDLVIWEKPRLVAMGRPDVFLRDVRSQPGVAGELVPERFGKDPEGRDIEPSSICIRAPSVLEVRLPADLAANAELVVTGTLHADAAEGSVQFQLSTVRPPDATGLQATSVAVTDAKGPWTANNRGISYGTPIVVQDGSQARRRFESEFDEFRKWFPPALCYTKIVPVDEVVTLTLFYREDDHLQRLMLSESESQQLDRLWDELHFVSHDALKLVDALEQLIEFATQDADPKVFEPLRKPVSDRADAFRRRLIEAEPRHVGAVLDLASRAYRRPLDESECQKLRQLYQSLRTEDLDHDQAIRLLVAKVLTSPEFLYRVERVAARAPDGRAGGHRTAGNGVDVLPESQPVSDGELATRLSFFLWSSIPDERLRDLAARGALQRDDDALVAESRRMLKDERVRRLATEFACQWLHVYEFDTHNEKSESAFPDFERLRGPMYEETIRFFVDICQRDGSILELLDADHTFVNRTLAVHYGIPWSEADENPDLWRRADGLKAIGRGGILGMASTLSKQSGASRTSPILRGNWVSESLLGEKLPKPPPGVPQLPDTVPAGLTERQLIEQHSVNPGCARCHARIDPLGFALERFDAIGRLRTVTADSGQPPIDTRARLRDGKKFEGLEGLRNYLLTARRDDFVRHFCRKLLGYALGRAVILSDEPLLDEMLVHLEQNDYRLGVAIEDIVRSPQFRRIRP